MIAVSELDAEVTESILTSPAWHTKRQFIAGDDNFNEIAKLRERGAEAMRQGDYQAAMAAMRQAEELESAPRVKPHWETVITEQSEADYFAAMDASQRRGYLAAMEICAASESITIGPRDDYFDVAA